MTMITFSLVVSPGTGEVLCEVGLGNEQDVDLAVRAAKIAFDTFGVSSKEERIDLMESVIDQYKVCCFCFVSN